jgi:putative endonuclease
MKLSHNYYVYITTDKNKTVLYTGVTNNLRVRIQTHKENATFLNPKTFTGKYNAYHLIFYEHYTDIKHAILREKEIKGWRRRKKIGLINSFNKEWKFLEEEV